MTAALTAELTAIFTLELHLDVPSPETDLLATGMLDSLGLVELLLQLERRYGIRVDLETLEIDHFRSVASIATFVAKHRQ